MAGLSPSSKERVGDEAPTSTAWLAAVVALPLCFAGGASLLYADWPKGHPGFEIGMLMVAILVTAGIAIIFTAQGTPTRLAVTLTTMLVAWTFVFAGLYRNQSERSWNSFHARLSSADALYFATTVSTTTGFGDLQPHSQPSRKLVTFQMAGVGVTIVLGVALVLSRGAAAAPRSSGRRPEVRAEHDDD